MRYKNIYRNELESQNIDYINQVIQKIEDSLISSSIKNNDEIFLELILFLRDDLILKSLNKSTAIYYQLLRIPTNIYLQLTSESKKRLIEIFTIRFTENISLINYSKKIDNEFLEISYLNLISLIKKIIDDKNNENYDLFFKKLKESIYIFNDEKDNYYNYSFAFTILFWLFHLFQNDKIDIKLYDSKMLENILSQTYDRREELINSFFKFRNEVEKGKWECENWQIIEPVIGEATFMLMSSTWLNFGFTIMLLKYHILDYNYEISKININYSFRYEDDTIIKNIRLIEDSKEKWFPVIYNLKNDAKSNDSSFEYSKTRIIEFFKILKKEQEIKNYKEISQIPLSQVKIEEFKEEVGSIWKSNSTIPTILKYFKRTTYLPNIFEKLGYGVFTTMLKSKFAFIDGEKYQKIYGLTDFGNETARRVNREFFYSLIKKDKTISLKKEKIKKEFDKYINNIKDKSKLVIFSNWYGLDILNNGENLIEYLSSSEIPFCKSKYRSIPIFNNYEFKDFIIIVDLNIIDYTIYQKETWFDKELLIEVTEPAKEDITDKIKKTAKWKERDGIEYSEDEIEVLEQNSVNIKILFKFEMEITDESKYIAFKIIN